MKLNYILDVEVEVDDSGEDSTEDRIQRAIESIKGVTSVEVMDVQ